MKVLFVRLATSLILVAAFVSTTLAGESFKIDSAHSTIGFKVKHFLGTAVGEFNRFEGVINLDRDHPERSSVSATIQTKSIDTAIARRDEHLRGTEFFNVAQYPVISFKSRSVKRTGPESGDILGDLTMHGVTRVITLHVKFLGMKGAGADERSRWHVTTEPIRRSQFGLVWSKTVESVSMIGDQVAVNIEIEAIKTH